MELYNIIIRSPQIPCSIYSRGTIHAPESREVVAVHVGFKSSDVPMLSLCFTVAMVTVAMITTAAIKTTPATAATAAATATAAIATAATCCCHCYHELMNICMCVSTQTIFI